MEELLRRPIYRLGLLMGLKSGTADTAEAVEVTGGASHVTAVPPRTLATATIAINTSLSAAVDLGAGQSLVGIQVPAAWTAAPVSLQVSADNVTYTPLYNSDGALVQQAAPAVSSGYNLPPSEMVGWRYVKIQSGIPGTWVNQTAARTIGLVTRSLA